MPRLALIGRLICLLAAAISLHGQEAASQKLHPETALGCAAMSAQVLVHAIDSIISQVC